MANAKTNFKEYKEILEKKGIKPSFHRLKILEYLKMNRIHPTADMLYDELSKEIPTLSRTTVYNTLKLFVNHGLVSALTIEDQELRFDIDTSPHGHFKCLKCGEIYDVFTIDIPDFESIDGHDVKQVDLYLRGICKSCKQN